MHPPLETAYPLLTTKAAVDFGRKKTGLPLTISRFHKDRSAGKAPKPIATFGNRDLFTEEQILQYCRKLIRPVERDGKEGAES